MTYSSESDVLSVSGEMLFLQTKNQTTFMPASRFLEKYHETDASFGKKDKKRLRRDMRNSAYSAFVKKFHTDKDYAYISLKEKLNGK